MAVLFFLLLIALATSGVLIVYYGGRKAKEINLTVLLGGRFYNNTPSSVTRHFSNIIKNYIYKNRKIKTSDRNIAIMYDDGLSAYNIKRNDIIFWREGVNYFDLKEHIGDYLIISPLKIDENPFRAANNIFQGKYIRKLVCVYDTVDEPETDIKSLKETIKSLLNSWRAGDYNFNGSSEHSYSLSIEQQYKELREKYPEETEFAILYARETCQAGHFDVTPVSEVIGLVEHIQNKH